MDRRNEHNEDMKNLYKAFDDHAQADAKAFQLFAESLDEIKKTLTSQDKVLEGQNKILEPIARTYRSASDFGKWAMTVAVFVSLIVGAIIGLKDFFHK